MIIIVNGNSGSGKTYLLQQLKEETDCDFVPFKKHTTRGVRDYEKKQDQVDLIYNCSKEHISSFKYNYTYKGEQYAVDEKELIKTLEQGKVPVLSVRSFDIIRKIKNDFEDVLVLFILGQAGKSLNAILKKQGRKKQEIGDTDEGLINILNEMVENIDLVDHTLNNSLYDRDLLIRQFFHYACLKRKEN